MHAKIRDIFQIADLPSDSMKIMKYADRYVG